ncbi:MAG: DUF2497 domain-containing protein, partial [Pseudomonadota bacterium]
PLFPEGCLQMALPEIEETFKPLPEPEPEPEPVAAAPMSAPTPAPQQEAAMAANPRYDDTVLTDDATAETAAGALGKLISTLDMGGDNTIEGLVRELLKPMIKDWLDANLPAIVERKVEAEVQRIAKMVG